MIPVPSPDPAQRRPGLPAAEAPAMTADAAPTRMPRAPRLLTPTARSVPRWLPWLVAAVAFAVRAVRLDSPPVYVFDELYYVGDAQSLLRSGVERGLPVHPPLGKWLIAAGIQLFGANPTGWRIAAVIAGAAVCATVASVAWHWTARIDLALLAGGLCIVDGILFTSSRIAMLDIFEAMFVVLFAHAATLAILRPGRRWVILAALWLGLGAATKWSALYCVPVLVAVIVWRARGLEGSRARRIGRALGRSAGAAGVMAGAYVLAYAPTFATNPSLANPVGFLRRQRDVVRFHLRLDPVNAYAQPAIDWLGQRYPAGLFLQTCQAGRATASGVCASRGEATTVAIVSLANPVVWIGGIAAVAVLAGRLLLRREAPAILALGMIAARWAPWLATRDGYSFYAAPLVPFLVLALVCAMALLPRRAIPWAAGVIGLLAAAAFAFFYPYWAAVPMTEAQLELRRWLDTWP